MILVTGGAGYIGSHCVMALLENNNDVVIFDNLSTGHIETVQTLQKYGNVEFQQGDLTNFDDINSVFKKFNIEKVVHFAAFSQVGESVVNPQKYYINNVCGTINLLRAMLENNVKKIVFSSTAATYGEPVYIPIDEKHPQNPINPYGQSKLMIEKIMDDYNKAYGLKSVRLRYFNVAGADLKSRIGEWHDPETHLIPNILKSTFNNGKTFQMFGDDYDTKDGTGVRDYIHVVDLAKGHVKAVEKILKTTGCDCYNLGTGNGYSVLDLVNTFMKVNKVDVPYEIKDRRPGDIDACYADPSYAYEKLGWKAEKDINEMCLDAYNFVKKD